MTDSSYILLIEDNPGDARLVRTMFEEAPTDALPQLRWEQSARAGADVLLSQPGCAAVLLDLGLPDAGGLEALGTVSEHAQRVPIIVLSGNDDEELGIAAVIGGAQDYLVKGSFDGPALRRALQYASHRKQVELALVARAMHDQLTGLPTRTLLIDRLGMSVAAAARSGNRGALLFIDLDRFKQINDCHGHRAGDAVLRAVAGRLLEAVRESDTVARVGGDEFIVLLPMIGHDDDSFAAAQKLLAALSNPVKIGDLEIPVSASVGLVEFRDKEATAEELIAKADQAMYVAKREGRSTVRLG